MRAVGWVLAAVLVFEVAIIDIQAGARHHQPLQRRDTSGRCSFRDHGSAILILWLGSVAVIAGSFPAKVDNPAWGWLAAPRAC